MPLPVIIAHAGYSPYLEFTLRQARAHVPADGLFFLGDAQNDRFDFLTFVDGARPDLQRAAGRVARVYQHRSTNTRAFELSAFQRWFRVQALMEAEGLADALVLDSDVLLYSPAAALAERFANCEVALSTPHDASGWRWVSSGHSAYWTTARLGECCAFIERMYGQDEWRERIDAKWHHHQQAGVSGGVCDMTAFFLYQSTLPPEAVTNTAGVVGGATLDHNVSRSINRVEGEYRMRGGTKAVEWEAGRPHVFNNALGQRVRFHTLHLQGPAKSACGRFYRGPAFNGQEALAGRLRRYYATRAAAGRVKAALWKGLARFHG